MGVRVQHEDFDLSAEVAALRAGRPQVGAVACFVGTVRDINQGTGVSTLTLEHYPGMTEKALEAIVKAAQERWTLDDVLVIHRIGALAPLDQIVLVAVTSAHRGEAMAACEFVIDWLKTDAPFWKKEVTPQGERWVDAREADEAAAARWGGR
jgi:molybdopterin synthase catalytic subunit